MVRELERLDSIEFVQPVKPKGLNAIREEHGAGDAFNLKDFVKITTEGRAYLDIRDAVLNARAGATTAGA